MRWAKQIVERLHACCASRNIIVGEELSTIIVSVPYIFMTRIVVYQRIGVFLDALDKALPKDETMEKEFPSDSKKCMEDWRTEKGWNVEAFSLAFKACFKNSLTESNFGTLILLMRRYDFLSIMLEVYTRPRWLRYVFDTSRLHRRQLTNAADETDLSVLTTSVEVGTASITEGLISGYLQKCHNLANFLVEGIRLAESVYPETLHGYTFEDLRSVAIEDE